VEVTDEPTPAPEATEPVSSATLLRLPLTRNLPGSIALRALSKSG